MALQFFGACAPAAPQDDADARLKDPAPVVAEEDWDYDAAVERLQNEEGGRAASDVEQVDAASPDTQAQMLDAVLEVEPYYRSRQVAARRLVNTIHDAAIRHEIDPWLALAIAYRESSFLPTVGNGRRRGALGEVGYFQIMPGGYAMRVCSQGRRQTSAAANADTAMCYLDHVRELCGQDPAIYVAAYGMRNCPESAHIANRIQTARRARQFLCRLGGQERCDTFWPLPAGLPN